MRDIKGGPGPHPSVAGYIAGLVLASVLFVSVGSAWAGGQFLPVQGVRALGRAGAATVQGAGPYGLWYNPATLANLSGWNIYSDMLVNVFSSRFERTPRMEPNGAITFFEVVQNDKEPDVLPSLIASWDLGQDFLTLALGFFPPTGYRYHYPADGPQRYTAVSNGQSLSVIMALALAVKLTDWLSVGLGIQNIYYDLKNYATSSAWPGVVGYPEDRDWDVLYSLRLVVPITLMGNLGIWVQIIEGLEAGFALQLGARVEGSDATIEMRLPAHPMFDEAEVRGNTVTSGFNLPLQLRAGLRYQHPYGDVELNLGWQGWSVYESISFEPADMVITGIYSIDEFKVRRVNMAMNWRDIWSLHLGGEVVILPDFLSLQWGCLYEQSAIPDEYLTLFQLDLEKVAPTLGVSLLLPEWNLRFDLAYSHVFMNRRVISNSRVIQSNSSYEEGGTVVGNGVYEGSFDLFGLAIELVY